MDKYPKYILEEQQELFERFLTDKMSPEERFSFESKLSKEVTLKKSFDEFKLLFEVIEEAGLRSKLDDFHKITESDEKTTVISLNKTKTKFTYRVAASVTILLAIGSFWFLQKPSANEKLFDEFYFQDPGLPTVMGSNDNYDFYEAMVDYKQGNYEIAIEKWKKLLITKPENDTLNYFLGAAFLANNQEEQALKYLRKNENNSSSHFIEETNFYLGLTYIKLNQLQKAALYLDKCSSPKSKELLKSIQKQ